MNAPSTSWLQKTDEIVYVSEKSGWRHLYLIDAKSGKEKNAITHGEFVVRGVDKIDEEKRQVWFWASGRNPDQDPYFMHYCRSNFDGTGFVALTEGNGEHTRQDERGRLAPPQFSPSRKYLIAQEVNLRGRMATEFLSNEDTVKLETAYVEVLKKLGQPQ